MRKALFSTLGIVIMFLAVTMIPGPEAFAQFGIKLPKLPDVLNDSKAPATADKAKTPIPTLPPPEVTNLAPNKVPAGWSGDVVLTGKNFLKDMTVTMECEGYLTFPTRDIRVDDATRATLKLQLPKADPDDPRTESKCAVTVQQRSIPSDINPSLAGSRTVVQVVAKVPFSISNESPLEMTYAACLIGEGEMPQEEFYEKYLEQLIKGVENCKLAVSPTYAKLVDGKTSIEMPASSIKALEPVELFPGQVLGLRFVLNSGKSYVFTDTGGALAEKIKARMKK